MKKIVFLILLMISCIYNINATEPTVDELLNNISSTKPLTESFSEYLFKPDTLQIPRKSGNLLLEIKISPNFDCKLITVDFLDIYNLDFNSQKNININVSKGETTSFYLDLNIPDEGKSGFSFNLNSDSRSVGAGGTYWFVSENGNIVFFNGHPGVSIGSSQTPTRSIGISDERSTKPMNELDDATIGELLKQNALNQSTEKVYSPFSISAKQLMIPMSAGIVKMTISIAPKVECDFINIDIKNINNINFLSNSQLSFPVSKEDTLQFELEFELPFQGNSSFVMESSTENHRMTTPIEFSSKDGIIVYYNGDPNSTRGSSQTPTRSIGISDEEFLQRKNEQEKRKQMAREDTTRIWLLDTAKNWHFLDKDSLRQSREFVKKSEINKMRELEKGPLTWATQQDISVGGKLYTRNKGEYKFRPLVPLIGPDADPSILAKEDSLDANRPDHLYHFVFDLRDTLNFYFIDSLIFDLQPMEKDGFYHGEIWKSMMRPVDDRKIRYKEYPEYPKDFNNIPSKKTN